MSNWKCEICGKEFENFQAQGFDNKVYCPLCFFKEKINRLEKIRTQLKEENQQLKETIKKVNVRNSKQRLANRKLQDKNEQLNVQIGAIYKDQVDYEDSARSVRNRAINYIDQVIGYKPCAREIDKELNTLVGILREIK